MFHCTSRPDVLTYLVRHGSVRCVCRQRRLLNWLGLIFSGYCQGREKQQSGRTKEHRRGS